MKYTKPPLTFQAQAELLLSRGLQADKNTLTSRLEAVNYYRLSAYLFPFRQTGNDTFKPNTTLDLIWEYYTFDRQLRILVMDAIERVEVAFRTQLVYLFAHTHGAFGHLNSSNFPKLNNVQHERWIKEIGVELRRSRETFIKHFHDKYSDQHEMPPLWMLCEIMTFGKILTLFNGVDDSIRRDIARDYGVPDKILKSWLGSLNVIRNICAHHGRLWNRELGFKPIIPHKNKSPQWHTPVEVTNNRIFAILTILRFLLEKVAPTSQWDCRFRELLKRYPDVPLVSMGFPTNWEQCPIWSKL